MKAAQVLALYEQAAKVFNEGSQELVSKELINDLASLKIPLLLKSQCTENADTNRIDAACTAAYETAISQLKEDAHAYDHANDVTFRAIFLRPLRRDLYCEEDAHAYDVRFRWIFLRALRRELYRQFLATGQDVTQVGGQYKSIKSGMTRVNSREPQFLYLQLSSKLQSEFRKFEQAVSGLNAKDRAEFDVMKLNFGKMLSNFNKKISSQRHTDLDKGILDAALDFEIEAGQLIRGYQIKYESHSTWAPFIKNIAFILTGVAIPFVLASLANKAIYGRYAFFDRASLVKRPENERSEEDELLHGLEINGSTMDTSTTLQGSTIFYGDNLGDDIDLNKSDDDKPTLEEAEAMHRILNA